MARRIAAPERSTPAHGQELPNPDPEVCRRPGRPRSEDHCRAIRTAALELLIERGFAEVTIESIAARAGVGKTTVYRRWPCKADLIVNAFFETVAARVHIRDSGDLRADFRRQLRLVVREMAGPNGRILATLIACMQMDADLAESFRTRWLAVRRDEGRLALMRGIERGELSPKTDPDLVLDALYSPLHFRLLAGHGPLSTDFSDRLVDLVFDGLGVKLASGSGRSSNAISADAKRPKRPDHPANRRPLTRRTGKH